MAYYDAKSEISRSGKNVTMYWNGDEWVLKFDGDIKAHSASKPFIEGKFEYWLTV